MNASTVAVLGSAFLLAAAIPAAAAPAPADGAAGNPVSQPWTLPYHYPPFDRIRPELLPAALDEGMAQEDAQVDAIARSPEPATFENTIVAMERMGRALDQAETVLQLYSANASEPRVQEIDAKYSTLLSSHRDAILQRADLFARVDSLWQRRATLGLDPESLQLLERTQARFVRAGARLSESDRKSLRALNERKARLTTEFRNGVLKATRAGAIEVAAESELDGLSPAEIGAARTAAEARGLHGKWLIALQNTTIQPVLAHLKNRALRERIWRASESRGAGGAVDNRPLIVELVRLRAQSANLLGYPTQAAFRLDDSVARTPAAADAMLAGMAPAAEAKAKEEGAALQRRIDAQERAAGRTPFVLQPWDWAYYAELERRETLAFDDAQVRPYFELDRVLRDGVFFAASGLYGLKFRERDDLPRFQPENRVFEVIDADGTPMGLCTFDLFARDNKQGGAWMNVYVGPSRLLGDLPVVTVNLNIAHPARGEPALLSFDETTTLFHEFGHALHGLLSDARYPSLAGTRTPRDFVEFPSQYNEMWARDPVVLAHYARHYQTGEPMPPALLQKALASFRFGQGYATAEYLAAARIDLAWHELAAGEVPDAAGVDAFEHRALARLGLDGPVAPRYHSGYFMHIFSHGYDAGYYAYIWSEVMARDAEHWFNTHGGLVRANGDFFRAKILSRGRTAEPDVLFSSFYGGPPEVGPLLEHRGLAKEPAGTR